MKKFVLLCLVLGLMVYVKPVKAQESENNGYNPNSVYPVHEDDIMYKKRVWRRMDLREKQNKPFFAKGNEITKHIVNAAKAGILPIYKGDSMVNRMTKEEFLEKLEDPSLANMDMGGGGDAWGDSGGGDSWGSDDGWGDSSGDDSSETEEESSASEISTEFRITQLSTLELVEDMIFDRKRSVTHWDIQAIKIIIPAQNFTSGVERLVGVFKYKDLIDLFRSNPEQMIWFNPQNSAEHKNLADAFALRLFSARIVKVANPDDNMIVDVYNESPKEGIMASQWLEYELMEKEHELWSY
ncbi:type IX secretion system ring subunit PorN/GldN [Marivirga arenosa]|uniref:Gliding motility protein GldN n=1 Tax=Marivirga arenosa TaxID=3059076 RepID=A0AA51N8N1_9BACT|nr:MULTISPECIES: gliding motility protein GldN [unclassified Marivirga]WMN07979.1 gliding motility protein GldN [Marivirga sp. ABR2-2]WNB17822.1 gliding motility protein GldN [Marivirga sp. BKB1-2]